MPVMSHQSLVVMVAVMLMAAGGCDPARRNDRLIPHTPVDPVVEARGLIESYAGGAEILSEREAFDDMVSAVRKVDPAKGEKLQVFFDGLKKSSVGAAGRAAAFLETF